MSEWDKLHEKLKSPEEKTAEAEARAQRQRAEAFRATSEALVALLHAFRKAQVHLAKRFGPNVFCGQHGEDSFLEFPGHKLSASRSGEHGAEIAFDVDGSQVRFVYRDSGFVAEGVVPMSLHGFDGFVARQVNALVP